MDTTAINNKENIQSKLNQQLRKKDSQNSTELKPDKKKVP